MGREEFRNFDKGVQTWTETQCYIGFLDFYKARTISTAYILLMIGAGVAVIVLGSLLSWVGSFMMVGFGELIEKTTEIAENTRRTY